jgi:endogenous inhibitor of DNA gyrase (YacG/DUF329 family)
VKCRVCGKDFYVKPSHQKLGWGKYCSIECRSTSQFRGKEVHCHTCNKEVYRAPAKLKHSKSGYFFCSKTCQTLWRNSYFIEERHPNWVSGAGSYREVLKRSGEKQVCRICKIEDERILTVHHVDHNRLNNKVSNLVWVCLNCHFLIHHYESIEKSLNSVLVKD